MRDAGTGGIQSPRDHPEFAIDGDEFGVRQRGRNADARAGHDESVDALGEARQQVIHT